MSTIPIRQNLAQSVAEGASARLTWDLVDEAGAEISLAQLGTLTWTHYDEATGTVVNDRLNIDIKNANGGTVDPITGECSLALAPEDNSLVDQASKTEWKVAFIRGTYNGGAGVVEKELAYKVYALRFVP